MLSWKNLFALFACLCLSFEISAQTVIEKPKPGIFYALLLKGMPAPFDTTVAIHVTEYRKIRTKVILADSLVNAKDRELAQAYKVIEEKSAAQVITLEILATSSRANERLTKTNAQLNNDYDELYLETTRPKKLIEKPWFLITVGAVGGAILKSL